MIWSDDDHLYTYQDDGFGWRSREGYDKTKNPRQHSCHMWRVSGDADSRNVEDLPNQPTWERPSPWFGFGVLSVDGVIYGTISRVGRIGWWDLPFRGVKLVYTPDHGNTWFNHDGRPFSPKQKEGMVMEDGDDANLFWEESPTTITDKHGKTMTGYAFASLFAVQSGKDNEAAKDDYTYWYSANTPAHELNLARVHKKHITKRDQWQFFAGWNDMKISIRTDP